MIDDDAEDDARLPRGVVYMGRVPPRVTPSKVKSLLQGFGEVTRVYLQEEDASVARRRKRQGSKGKHYVEGWIEFRDQKVAKRVARSLNTTEMGKRNYDLWNLKYLKGFTWDHLREKIAFERRVQSQKVKLRVSQAKKANADYLDLVDQGKTFHAIEERKKASGKLGSESKPRRTFHQIQAAPTRDSHASSLLDDL